MDQVAPQHTTGTFREAAERWWSVVVGVILTAGFPPVGILFALIMVWMRRWDRTVMIALIAIAVVGVIYLAVRVSTNSGVVS